MGEERWFVRGDEEWLAMAERLKQTPCPHCKVVGTLNRHGSLLGYDESSPQQRMVRARRVFCSNRQARRGCGRTFSVWAADKIRRLSLTTVALWRFLQAAVASGILAAEHAPMAGGASGPGNAFGNGSISGKARFARPCVGGCSPPERLADLPKNPCALSRPRRSPRPSPGRLSRCAVPDRRFPTYAQNLLCLTLFTQPVRPHTRTHTNPHTRTTFLCSGGRLGAAAFDASPCARHQIVSALRARRQSKIFTKCPATQAVVTGPPRFLVQSIVARSRTRRTFMKQPSVYLKMRVLGAVDTVDGRTRHEQRPQRRRHDLP